MKGKISKIFNKEPLWTLRSFLLQPIVFTKTEAWVKNHNCSYSGSSNKYDYYWYGDFNTGKQVKIRRNKNV